MNRGYIKLWRKSLDSQVFHDPHLWQLWTWCLLRTNREQRFLPKRTGKGQVTIKVEAGQFVFGRLSAAAYFDIAPSTIWRRMKKLQEIGLISIQSDSQYSIITVCNWKEHQEKQNEKEQPTDTQRTPNGHPSDTNKNKENKENKDIVGQDLNGVSFKEVIDHLNRKTGKNFKHTTEATRKHISARVSEGYTVEDFKKVIDNKAAQWLNDPEMNKFLRPETLFLPSKFEGYLNEQGGGGGIDKTKPY